MRNFLSILWVKKFSLTFGSYMVLKALKFSFSSNSVLRSREREPPAVILRTSDATKTAYNQVYLIYLSARK